MDPTANRKKFIINAIYFAIIIAIIYFVIAYAIGWLLPFIIGFIIAYLLNPLINWIRKKIPIARGIISTFFVILIYALVGLLSWFIIWQLLGFSRDIFLELPRFYNNHTQPLVVDFNLWLRSIMETLSPEMRGQWITLQGNLLSSLGDLISNLSQSGFSFLTNVTQAIPGFLIGFIFTILASLFTSMHFPNVTKFIMTQLPQRGRLIIREIRRIFVDTILRYIKAYLKIMLITFVELSIGFLILGLPNAILIALGIAIFDVLPVFGTGGIMIPWIIIEFLLGNYQMAIGLLIIYAVVTVVRNFVEPKIVGDQLGLNPIIALICIYLGFVLWGFLGVIILPIIVQIALTLHRSGMIKLFREEIMEEDKKEDIKEKEPEDPVDKSD